MKKVRHDGKVWDVFADALPIDGEPAYALSRGDTDIVARVSECKVIKPHTRRIRGPRFVLESYADGTLKVRRCRSPRRYPVTLEQIYDLGVRLQVFKNGRLPKALRPRSRR